MARATTQAVSSASWTIDQSKLRWHLDKKRLQITRFGVAAYGGTAQATARIPFGDESFEATGTFTELASGSLIDLSGKPFELSGPVSGSFSLSGSMAEDEVAVEIEFRGPRLSAYTVDVSEIRGTGSYADGQIRFQAEGRAMDGVLSVEGGGNLGSPVLSDVQLDGKVDATGIDIAALGSIIENRQLRGKATANLEFSVAGPSLSLKPTGQGRLSVERLRWRDVEMASSARAEIELSDDELVVRNISARIRTVRGPAHGEVRIPLSDSRSGTFRVSLERVQSRRVFAFSP